MCADQNNTPHCPKCGSDNRRKSGLAKGAQRYECKDCGCHYTRSTRHGYSEEQRLRALEMYREGLGFRRIGRLLKVSNVCVLNWIRSFGQRLKEKISSTDMQADDVEVVVMDELWHYTQKNRESYGYGLLCLVPRGGSSRMKWALVAINGRTDSGPPSRPDVPI